MQFKEGDVVAHKAAPMWMVVIDFNQTSQTKENLICKYYNPVTGK